MPNRDLLIDNVAIAHQLAEWGAQGWELVEVLAVPAREPVRELWFKRPLPG